MGNKSISSLEVKLILLFIFVLLASCGNLIVSQQDNSEPKREIASETTINQIPVYEDFGNPTLINEVKSEGRIVSNETFNAGTIENKLFQYYSKLYRTKVKSLCLSKSYYISANGVAVLSQVCRVKIASRQLEVVVSSDDSSILFQKLIAANN